MNISSISGFSFRAEQTMQPSPDHRALIQAVKAVNAAGMFGEENELTFVIDRAAKIAVVRIINKKTGEVVQQIPNEDVLKLAEENSGR